MRVRTDGAWEEWLDFFLEGVTSTATRAMATTGEILRLFDADRIRIGGGGAAASTHRVFELLTRRAVVADVAAVARGLGLSPATGYRAIADLEALGIVRELTGRRRDRIWAYDAYLQLLNAGTESPLPPRQPVSPDR